MFSSISHSFTVLTSEISTWTQEEKSHFSFAHSATSKILALFAIFWGSLFLFNLIWMHFCLIRWRDSFGNIKCFSIQPSKRSSRAKRKEEGKKKYIWRGVWNKALSDFWCNVKFSSSFTTEYKEIWNENLVIYQKSLKAFLQAPLHFIRVPFPKLGNIMDF